ncbi:MAG TPA: methyltransferase domain-containing protein [Planctomycetota bacterium]
MSEQAEAFDPARLPLPRLRDRRRALRRWLRPRWAYVLSHSPEPISDWVGNDRGTPIDRVAIEGFLDHHRGRVRGRALEVKDRKYTARFGAGSVTRSDVLDINRENPEANILDDLRSLATIPDGAYDCFILTQVLQYVDDLDAAIRSIRRVLAPGGSAIVTVPTLGKLDGQEDKVAGHYWRMTPDSARHLFSKHFENDGLEIHGWGNARLASAFLSGLCVEDLSPRTFATYDPVFTCGVLIRATRQPS